MDVELGGRRTVLNVPIRDASPAGAFLRSRTLSGRCDVGQLYQLALFSSHRSTLPIRAEAMVVRKAPEGVGIAFTHRLPVNSPLIVGG
jgi:hypothetical protein